MLGVGGLSRRGTDPLRLDRVAGEDGLDHSLFGKPMLEAMLQAAWPHGAAAPGARGPLSPALSPACGVHLAQAPHRSRERCRPMKLAPSLIMLAQSVPFAARLLPLLAAEEVPPQARWEREYASGRWSYLGGVDELAHYSVIVGYYAFLKPGGSVLDVGCGEGILQTRLSPHGYCRYLGIDFAAGAIHQCGREA